MTILVSGATGRIGSLVLDRLVDQGVTVKALARNIDKLKSRSGVEPVQGDMTDVASMRAALGDVDTLFLINAVVPDEVTQALITLDLARESGIKRIVYFSVFNSQLFLDVPHFAGKGLVERVIDAQAIPATVLRPAYFMQNDVMLLSMIRNGVYPQPVGDLGAAMVDERDIADIAASELLRRERAAHALPRNTIEITGPEVLSGEAIARIWSEELGKAVSYVGNDLAAFETQMATMVPGWMAHDFRLMLRAFHTYGMLPGADTKEVIESLMGHPLRTYRDFVRELVSNNS